MNLVVLCRRMNWTWTELMDQPEWFIVHMTHLLVEEARKQNKNK